MGNDIYIYIYIYIYILLPYDLQVFFIDARIEMIRYMYQHKRMNDTNFDDPLKLLKMREKLPGPILVIH